MTDPEFLERLQTGGVGEHLLGESLLTVSLAEKHKDHNLHKLVAGIVERGQQETGAT